MSTERRSPRAGAHRPAGVAVLYDVAVPMADGVRLSADIYLPTDVEGPYPAVLYRTPYNGQMEYLVDRANFFAQNGYAVVCQDVRGRYDSEGEFRRWVNEFEDGARHGRVGRHPALVRRQRRDGGPVIPGIRPVAGRIDGEPVP